MVALANISDKSVHPHTNLAIIQSSLVILKNGLRHLVPRVILHLVIYRLLIFFKIADDTTKTGFAKTVCKGTFCILRNINLKH